ncbi:NPCBM/NEW2 domain-containing protein [Nocardia bovistercoris]|uniref:NPCBM/NEW2 domain-containing protein n=1 Tax=Nocardia bovistercoris TaxID=2785916 RepID=A0A931IJE5_9NOCA|nr:NPCBM/NEW2 domain-containing protein [Nocardia bovistercoris]MBH0781395.1 NPCBM/NEW2 domain-containing protein [Nocardia bovistercoris]
MNFAKKKPLWIGVITAATLLVVTLANIDGAWSFIDRITGDDSGGATQIARTPALPPATTTTTTATTTSGTPTSTSTTSTTGASTSPSSTRTTSAEPRTADGWYDLVEYQSVSWNNGFDPVDPIRIGAASFPSSIVGYYPSSSSDPMNKATWTIGGGCDRFSAWIGKDSESSSSAGVGRFVIKTDDREIYTAEMAMNDGAREVDLDISGAVRLTLLDTRRSQDAKNAWGRPRVHCATAPGRKR